MRSIGIMCGVLGVIALCFVIALNTGTSPKTPEKLPENRVPKQLQADVQVKKIPAFAPWAPPKEADIPALASGAEQGDPAAQAGYGAWLILRRESEAEVDKGLALLKTAAASGNAVGQMCYGQMLLSSWNSDPTEGAAWLEKAAEQGNAQAIFLLAEGLYARGEEERHAERAALLRRAACAGYAQAAQKLGMLYFQEREFPHDAVAAYTWLYLARNGFSEPAVVEDEERYDEDSYDNPLKFLAWTMTLDEMRQVEAALAAWPDLPPEAPVVKRQQWNNRPGENFRKPPPVVYPKDVAALKSATEAGDAQAQLDLGLLYLSGRGEPRDVAKAFALIAQSADAGNAEAGVVLGTLYQEGGGTEKSREKAAAAYTRAAEAGSVEAGARLAELLMESPYEDERSEEKQQEDYETGRALLEQAAGKGNVRAMFKLAAACREKDNYDEAARWYEQAAAAGSEDAVAERLGLAERRRSVSDLYTWMSIYMSFLPPEDRLRLRGFMLNFAGGLTDEEVLRQKIVADTWLKEHPQALIAAQEARADEAAFAAGRDASGATALHKAVRENNTAEVERLIAEKVNPDIQDFRGGVPLHQVALAEAFDAARLLLDAGAYLDAQDAFNNTPLMAAVEAGNVPAAAFLLAAGADTSLADSGGSTVLHKAVMRGSVETLRVLLEAGANPNPTAQGSSPLILAVQLNLPEMVAMLLQAGASPNAADQNERTPLTAAVMVGRPEMVKALLEAGGDPNIVGQGDNSMLHLAVNRSDDETVALLLEAKADPNHTGPRGEVALYTAVQQRCKDIVNMLLASKADPNLATKEKGTAMHAAAGQDDAEFMRMLLAVGGNPDAHDAQGKTPLHLAADRGNVAVLEMLLAVGGNPDALNAHGETPLHLAAGRGNIAVLEMLLKAGADPNRVDKSGFTALSEAVRHSNGTPMVKMLLAAKADPSVKDSLLGSTPLHVAAREGNSEQVALLLAAGADTGIVNNDGRTPLDIAANDEISAILEKAGAHSARPQSQSPLFDELGRPMNRAAEEAMKRREAGVQEKSVHVSFFGMEEAEEFQQTLDREKAGDKSPYLTRAVLMDLSLEELGERIRAGVGVNDDDPVFGLPLLQAIKQRRSTEMIAFLLANGADPNKGKPILGIGSSKFADEVLQLLLAAGADPNTLSDEGEPALTRMVRNGGKNATVALIKAGAKVDAKDTEGNTALAYALQSDDRYDLVPILLESGAAVKGSSALQLLSWDDKAVPVAELLLKHGASATVVKKYYGGLLHWAVASGNKGFFDAALKAGALLNARDESGDTVLLRAVEKGEPEMVLALIAAGAPVNGSAVTPGAKFVDTGGTVYDGEDDMLAQAVHRKNVDVVKVLLENGVHLNARENRYDRRTALHVAVEERLPEIARLIVKAGADPNIPNRYKRTPLHAAVGEGDAELVTALLAAKADPNRQDRGGETPLYRAVEKGRIDIVKALLTAGADPDVTTDGGLKPEDVTQDPEILKALRAVARRQPME